jgi:hypothetical protein
MEPSPLNHKFLIFAEDPGAVNYIARFVDYLESRYITYVLVADGYAKSYFSARNKPLLDPSSISVGHILEASFYLFGVTENKETLAFKLLVMSQKHNLKSAAIIDSGVNAIYRFRGTSDNPLRYLPDYVFTPDSWTTETFKSIGVPPQRILQIGQPWTKKPKSCVKALPRSRSTLFRKKCENRFLIVFISELSDGYNSADYQRTAEYSLLGRGFNKGRTQIVAEELLDAVRFARFRKYFKPYLVLRLHPKQSLADFGLLSREFDYVSTKEDPLQLVISSDLVVGMSSMLLQEAHWSNCNVLSIVPKPEERDWLPDLRNGKLPCISSRVELRKYFLRFGKRVRENRIRKKSLKPVRTPEFHPDKILKFLDNL